jgi:Flp pilus assembly protein TadG
MVRPLPDTTPAGASVLAVRAGGVVPDRRPQQDARPPWQPATSEHIFLGRRRRCRRLGVRERGQSTVELAIVLPLIALVIFGCLKVGIAFFSYQQVASAANAAARAAAVNHSSDPTLAARTAAKAISPTVGLSDSQIAVTYVSTKTPPGTSWSYPGTVTVEITYPVTFSFLGQLPQVFNLKATATKRLER